MDLVNYEKEILIIRNYMEMGRYNLAIERLSAAIQERTTDAYLLYLFAFCLYKTEEYNNAIDCCKSAVDNGFDRAEGYFLLSMILLQKDEYEESERLLKAALELAPQNPEYFAFYGYLKLCNGNSRDALQLINHALEIDAVNLSALQYKFYYYLDMDDSYGIKSKVIEDYFALSTDESDRFLKAGLLEYQKHDYKAAEENFRQAFQLDPTNKFILKMLDTINRKPRFIYYWKRKIKRRLAKQFAIMKVTMKAKWIIFKYSGLTKDTRIFVALPVLLLVIIAVLLIALL
ncbi:tetratricopeptide repeat protein [Anaerocolumna sp. AGMB13020]|uniref:tetratricopeptide repeat protein n=1 Tax=Anaerocolumna sp. AGMB13020 TaxID=3081750 RepID=UPI002952C10A|nr:tetratricopeptide repeat protein [Anaerocolumna sp. AGMB13020]WOO37676.1 tetratricopeptide repeat protein [Anaerocolumna sp. AGMB13020]